MSSARCSQSIERKSPARARAGSSSEDGNMSSSSQEGDDFGVVGSGTGSLHGRLLIGRKILKRLGDNTVMSGHVKEYNSPVDGNEETWTVHYENPHAEDDPNSDDDEEVNRAELDKLLNLQKPQTPSKRGSRGRPKKGAAKLKPKPKPRTSPSRSAAASPKRSPGGRGGKKRSASSASSSSSGASSPVTPTPRKKMSKTKKGGANNDPAELRRNEADIGKRVAKEFTDGVFTGEVVEVRQTGARGSLWKIDYEDGDMEDLNEEEMKRFMQQYQLLSDKFMEAKGHPITAEDLADEDLEEEDEGCSRRGGGRSCHKILRAFRREGKVVKFFPEESDDEHGDMWLINYDDGDAEHLEYHELAPARANYNKCYGLMKKRVALPTNTLFAGQPATNLSKKGVKISLYGETPVGARGIFATIKGYRRYKSMHPS
eukprot:g2652.t1